MKARGPLIVLALTTLVAVAGLAVPFSEAGGCYAPVYGYRTYYPRPVYQAPCYHAPAPVAVKVKEPPVIVQKEVVVQEVLAPAFVFQVLSAYQPPAQTVHTGQQGGYSFGQQFRKPVAPAPQSQASQYSAAPQPGLSQDDAVLLARLARLLKASHTEEDPVPRLSPGGAPPPEQPRQGNEPSAGEKAAIDYMATACASCHQAPAQKGGGVILFSQAGDFQPQRKSGQPITPEQVYEAMASGSMPLMGPKIPPTLLAGIAHWQNQR